MKIVAKNKTIVFFAAIVLISVFGRTSVFALWNGTFYNSGDTLNPECLPTDVDCDVLPPLASLAGAVLTDQTLGQTLGATGARLVKLWATNIATSDLTVTNPIAGSVTGNAATATALQTARAIYGNNFDGTAALSQMVASTYGGTGNG